MRLGFFLGRFHLISHDEGNLGEREEKGQGHDAEGLEACPEVGGLRAPDDFVQDGKHKKEESPAQRQLAPALFRSHASRRRDRIGRSGLLKPSAPNSVAPNSELTIVGLILMSDLIVQKKGQRAEDSRRSR